MIRWMLLLYSDDRHMLLIVG